MSQESKCPVCRKMFKPNTHHHKYCSTECGNRAKKIKARYGIDSDTVVQMYKKQNGRCLLCNVKGDVHELGFYDRPVLVIDHNHATGRVRGLLCSPCNLGLGKLQDDWEIIYHAYRYVKKWDGVK